MKEIEINHDLRGTARAPYALSKVVYDSSAERLTVYCKNSETFEYLNSRLQMYAYQADGDPIEPRKFTATFDKAQDAVSFERDILQAVDILVVCKLTTDALKDRFKAFELDSTKATGDSRESGDTWVPGPSLWSGDAPDFSHHAEKTPLLNDQSST